MSKYIALQGLDNVRVVATGQALREEALQKTRKVAIVIDEHSQQQAIAAVAVAKGLMKSVEQSRKEVKAPLLDWGKQIDSVAVDFCSPLHAEVNRLETLIAAFQNQEARRVEAENTERLKRQIAEQQEALRIQKAQDEASRKAMEATTEKQRQTALKLQAELAQQRAELEIESAEAESNRVIEAPKAEGASVRQTYDFTVLDVAALYAAHPDCVKLEPKKSAIRNLIEFKQISGAKIEIPGVKIREVTKVAVRSVPASIALE